MMKMTALKYFTILASALSLATSCMGGFEPSEPVSHDYPVKVTADGEATRVSLDGTAVRWETTDKLNVTAVAADKSSATAELSVYEIGPDGHSASFSGFVTMPADAPQECYFTHPTGAAMEVNVSTGKIHAVYTAQDGTHKPFMYAKTGYDLSGVSAVMNYVGAVLEITVSESLAAEVDQISFCGNNLESLSPIIIDPSDNSFTTPSEVVHQISVPLNKSGKTYLSVPPVNLTKGFTLICSNADGTRNMFRSFSSDGTLSGGYDLSAKKGRIIPVSIDGTFESFAVTCSAPVVEHTKKDGLLNGTSVSFVMNKQGASNKLIQEWGATLSHISDDGEEEVRKIVFPTSTPIAGQTVTMDVANDWKLIEEGTYVFAPYYKAYGQVFSLPTQMVSVPDPGVKITIEGSTSYDALLASGADVANTYSNTEIRDLKASINVHTDIIDSYTATLDGEMLNAVSSIGSSVSFGTIHRSTFQQYPMVVSVKCGKDIFDVTRNFEITGLPMEAVFSSDPSVWTPKWSYYGNASFTNRWLTFRKGTGAWKTPKYNIPSSCPIKVSIDASTNCTGAASRKVIYLIACSSTQNAPITSSDVTYSAVYDAKTADALKEKGYSDWISGITLTGENNAMMFSNTIDAREDFLGQFRVGIFKIKIYYN